MPDDEQKEVGKQGEYERKLRLRNAQSSRTKSRTYSGQHHEGNQNPGQTQLVVVEVHVQQQKAGESQEG